jgi:hypothetical protein
MFLLCDVLLQCRGALRTWIDHEAFERALQTGSTRSCLSRILHNVGVENALSSHHWCGNHRGRFASVSQSSLGEFVLIGVPECGCQPNVATACAVRSRRDSCCGTWLLLGLSVTISRRVPDILLPSLDPNYSSPKS